MNDRDPWIYSYGWEPETEEQLRVKAETAERVIGYYGVTVWAWASPPKDSIPKAKLSLIRRHFDLQQTTKDPFHYTLIFRKPLTQEQTTLFNNIFSKQTGSSVKLKMTG